MSDNPVVRVVSVDPRAGIEQSLEVQFSDGPWVVPGWMIAHLGGAEEFKREYVPTLSGLTYSEFTSSFMNHMASARVQNIFQNYINRSLKGSLY